LDARSDLYSFGVLAFRTLSGKLPFVGPGPRNFVAQHISTPPIPLYQAAPELVAYVPLCELVMRCLQKNPTDRPQTALELSEALSRALRAPKDEPLALEPPTPASGNQAAVGRDGSPREAAEASTVLESSDSAETSAAPEAPARPAAPAAPPPEPDLPPP